MKSAIEFLQARRKFFEDSPLECLFWVVAGVVVTGLLVVIA